MTMSSKSVDGVESLSVVTSDKATLDNVHEERISTEDESVKVGVIHSEATVTKSGWMGGIADGLSSWKASFGKKNVLQSDL